MSIDSLVASMSSMQMVDISTENYWLSIAGYQKVTDAAVTALTPGAYLIGPTSMPRYKVIYYADEANAPIKSEMIEIFLLGTQYFIKVWAFGNGRGIQFYRTVPEMLAKHYSFLTHPLSP